MGIPNIDGLYSILILIWSAKGELAISCKGLFIWIW